MPRPKSTWPPKPKPQHDSMRVWWNGKWHHLGPAADDAAWKKELGRLIELWRTDPGAAALDAHELPIAELYRDYMASADAPTETRQRGLASTALDLLSERYGDRPVAECTVGDLEDWMRWLARLPPREGRRSALVPVPTPPRGGGGDQGGVRR